MTLRKFGGWPEILVPVRGGADAYEKVELAIALAKGLGSRVTVLNVVDERVIGDPEAGLVRETLNEQLRQEGETLLTDLAALARGTDVPLTTRLERGPVVETIVKVAGEIGAGAIVVGAHKQTWLGRLLGGSLAEAVLRAASCAVIAVPPSTDSSTTPASSEKA
jgi:nucleotide-binding universal stress UspA family protein